MEKEDNTEMARVYIVMGMDGVMNMSSERDVAVPLYDPVQSWMPTLKHDDA